MFQEKTIFESSWFVFVAIADDVLVAWGCGRDRFPFAMRRKAGAPHATQIGSSYFANDGIRRLKRPGKALSTAAREPRIEVCTNTDLVSQ
jgi:hypothetical protein